jgi:2-polyprenyl-3-methyl-5-hydroxy-6-metoxy-1,4-benzoquinol methylase
MADTTETIDQVGVSAATQSDLWGERARDWAEVMEGWNGWGIPLYRQVLGRLNLGAGTDLLDVGCGAGRFCRIAADRGARVSGIDATAPWLKSHGSESATATSASATWRPSRGRITRSTLSRASTPSSLAPTWCAPYARRGGSRVRAARSR